MQDLGTLGGGYSVATAINNLSEVTGFSRPNDLLNSYHVHAFVWTPTGGMRGAHTLGGLTGEGVAINERGISPELVLDPQMTAHPNVHATLWSDRRLSVAVARYSPGRDVGSCGK